MSAYIDYSADVSILHSRLKETEESRCVLQQIVDDVNGKIKEMLPAEQGEEKEISEIEEAGDAEHYVEEEIEIEEDSDDDIERVSIDVAEH